MSAIQIAAKDFSLRFATFEMTGVNKDMGRRKATTESPLFSSPLSYMVRCHSEHSEESHKTIN